MYMFIYHVYLWLLTKAMNGQFLKVVLKHGLSKGTKKILSDQSHSSIRRFANCIRIILYILSCD